MDSISQMVLGASVGYAVAGKQYGKKALIWGAAMGTLPDLDFIPTLPFDDELIYLKTHRGITHSILFSVAGALGIAWGMKKWKGLSFKTVGWFAFWVFLTHAVLDALTTWGTQLFWPHPHRVSWNTLFIVDPLYTLPFIAFLLGALFIKDRSLSRTLNSIGLVLSTLYIVWAVGVKFYMNTQFETAFKDQNMIVTRYTTRPTAFNTLLWSTTAETQDGYYHGLISLLDTGPPEPFYFIPKHHDRLGTFTDKRTQDLLFITNGYFTVEETKKGIVIHDLRYGLRGDPKKHGPQYIFSYEVWKDSTGKTVMETIDPQSRSNTSLLLGELWERLKGI